MLFKSKDKRPHPIGFFTTKGNKLGSKRKKNNISFDSKDKSRKANLGKLLDTSFVYYDED